ncbi:hypothetical protein SUGI_0111310 [Cryptomeria japonica]|uniref:uncharacterized protein LOC131078816 n=1 Tax=Cryptomeria japonica TaxID=3369 RepID=UPI002408E932|nr:uncharacterized protein LOC131078816 [Cryptomeria japonica]GLJ09534.1 hypothetical protein SUGI_0111310 [Cryptomeria japonica]
MGFYESVKCYVQRRKYQRIDSSARRRRRRLRVAKMGSRKRRMWRLKRLPRLKLRWFNPKRLLVKLRDAYVQMMLSMANSSVFSSDMAGVYGDPFGQRCVKEYDPKMLVEIYRSLMIQGQGNMQELRA